MTEDVALHPELASRGSFAHLKLGKRPRKNDPRTLRLAKYLTKVEYPDHVDWGAAVPSWPMYGNDTLGDCTIAAAGHMIQAWTAGAGTEATPAETDVVAAYWATGSDDSGRFELDVLNFWRTQGVAGHEILAYVAVDPQSLDQVRYAIATFGGVYTGAALPMSAQGQQAWTVVGDGKTGSAAPGSWGGHAIPYVAYDLRPQSEQGGELVCVTWGATLKLSEAFHLAYCDELYAIVTKDWVTANGDSPTGLDLDALLADLHVVEQQPTPEGITVGEHDDGGGFRSYIPDFPLEHTYKNAVWWVQELPSGSVVLKFAPAQALPTPQGMRLVPMPPASEIVFSPEGWKAFERDVVSKGEESDAAKAARSAGAGVATPPPGIVLPR